MIQEAGFAGIPEADPVGIQEEVLADIPEAGLAGTPEAASADIPEAGSVDIPEAVSVDTLGAGFADIPGAVPVDIPEVALAGHLVEVGMLAKSPVGIPEDLDKPAVGRDLYQIRSYYSP